MPGLRSPSERPAPSPIRATARTRSQSQRRVYGPALPRPSPPGPSDWRRSCLVERTEDRRPSPCPAALGASAPQRGSGAGDGCAFRSRGPKRMTTAKQITANRENANRSTGPRTSLGKRKSRRNALRHGLTAETVIDVLENAADYEALASAINADFRPATNFELQLIARLISLLWRLRRATEIESGLLALEADSFRRRTSVSPGDRLSVLYSFLPCVVRPTECAIGIQDPETAESHLPVRSQDPLASAADNRSIACAYLQLATKDGQAIERLRRYETSLWRQTIQIVLLLNATNRRNENVGAVGRDRLRLGSLRSKSERTFWPPFGPNPNCW